MSGVCSGADKTTAGRPTPRSLYLYLFIVLMFLELLFLALLSPG